MGWYGGLLAAGEANAVSAANAGVVVVVLLLGEEPNENAVGACFARGGIVAAGEANAGVVVVVT